MLREGFLEEEPLGYAGLVRERKSDLPAKGNIVGNDGSKET